MKYLLTTKNSWLAAENETNESELVAKIKKSSLIISDLDGTDASAGQKLALEMMLSDKYATSRHMWKWTLQTIHDYATNPDAESKAWKSFVETFLRNPAELKRIERKITPKTAEKNLYSGIKEFYQQLPNAEKAYITRNIRQITQAYQQALSFDFSFPESFDKISATKQLIQQTHHTKIIVRGDTAEEQKIANYLRELQKDGQIQTLVYINITKTKRQYNSKADINTTRNHTAINEWLRQNKFI